MRVLERLLFSDTIGHFVNGLYAENKSPGTIYNYEMNLRMFQRFIAVDKLQELTPFHVRAYLADRAKNTSPATVHQAYRVLSTFSRWCIREGLLEKSPMENIKPPRLEKKVINTFSPEEIKALLSHCPPREFLGARNRAIILCLLDTGMRVAELVGMKLEDVDFKLGICRILGKGNKERLVRLGDNARQSLWRYLIIRETRAPPRQEYLWLGEELKPLSRSGVLQIINNLGTLAGIEGVRCSPHTLRHTFAVNFLRAGGNIFDLQTLGGWSSLEMVKRYSSTLNSDDALRAHQRFSPADRML